MPLATLGKAAAMAAVAAVTDIVATGTYTGDGATNRTISLAFTPKLVILINETFGTPMYISNIDPNTSGWNLDDQVVASVGPTANASRPGLTTNGFIVSGSPVEQTNGTSRVFYYFAFG